MQTKRFAGAAGGVGTTVLAGIADAVDAGRDLNGATHVVARNDYRCFKVLAVAGLPVDVTILLVVEPDRALTVDDLRQIIDNPIITIPHDPALARADDAGMLDNEPRFAVKAVRTARKHLAATAA